MLSVLTSWIIIFSASFIFGYIFITGCYKKSKKTLGTMDIYLISGLMLVNVYAEFFSIWDNVAGKACLLLAILGVALFFVYAICTKTNYVMCMGEIKRIPLRQWAIGALVVVVTLLWTVKSPAHYDTALYHQQAIAWIEEYGVVQGLGNLHNRFAYNSAFMPLQALFSFKWLIGQSLHTVNGYICCIFLIYALLTNNILKKQPVRLSDLLKVAGVIYICKNSVIMSSPSSDTLTMLLVIYICIKWSEFCEADIEDALPYTFLCVLCVYAISVKLSAAVCIIFVIYPVAGLIKNKNWKEMITNLIIGFTVVFPWLVRNVIISGYLLYPYPQFDFFDVDWKMPASVLTFDSREIMVWGRGLYNVTRYNEPIWKWIPNWFIMQNLQSQIFFVLGISAMLVLIAYLAIKFLIKSKEDFRFSLLYIYSIFGVAVWMFTAPLMRYGEIYLLIPICEAIWIGIKNQKQRSLTKVSVRILATIVLIPHLCSYAVGWNNNSGIPLARQGEYMWTLTAETELDGEVKIWFPEENDQSSYDVFPCIPYPNMLKRIELRGTSLKDGFKMKAESKALHLNAYGNEW